MAKTHECDARIEVLLLQRGQSVPSESGAKGTLEIRELNKADLGGLVVQNRSANDADRIGWNNRIPW